MATARTSLGVKTGQALAKAGQAIPAGLHGLGRQVAVFVQAAALAHGFFQILGAAEFAVLDAANFQAKTVGAQIDGGEAISCVH